ALKELDNEESRISEASAEISRRLDQIERDLARENDLAKEAAETIARLETERSSLESNKIEEARAIEAAQAALLGAREALMTEETKLATVTTQITAAEAKKTTITARANELAERGLRLKARVREIDSEREKLTGKISTDQRLAEAERNVANFESQLATARENLKKAEEGRLQAEKQENSARAKAAEKQASKNEIAAEIKALTGILGEPDSDLFPPLIDALEVTTGFETALATALGEDLTAPIDEAAERHWASLGPLPDKAALPANIRPLSDFVKGPPALERRLSSIGVVSSDMNGMILRKQLKPGQWLVSKSGEFWRWDGFTVAAGVPSAAATRLSQRNRLDALNGSFKTADTNLQTAKTAHEMSIKVLAEASNNEKESRQMVEVSIGQLDGARDSRTSLLSESSGAAIRLASLEEASAEAKNDLAQTQKLETEVADALDAASTPLQLKSSIDKLHETVNECKNLVSECQIKYNRLETQYQLRREGVTTNEKELSSWRERTLEATERLDDLLKRQKDIQNQAQTLSERPSEIARKRQDLLELIRTSEEAQSTASDELTKGEMEQTDADRESQAAEAALSDTREEMVRQQGFVEQASQDCKIVVERIREKLGCLPEEALGRAGLESTTELPERETVETDISKLLRSRDAIGPVNLRAETELEDINERIEAMGSEREDLLSAIARLRHGISSLNKEGRARLLEAFDEVKTHFEDLFVRLFGGGRAFIQLTEADDPLEAGLEIMTSPPGKKLQVMSLLSGGEQALTALALLFAVFLTNPAPICVLDEVDAPLDDANVDRFCTMLEEIARSGTTRFLCVTHHRMTMARMDRLFGVTMGERGVSQLVSVDLGGAQKIRDSA
ncbi:MAG: chromosome partitioning protein ParA, partial [Pseudomonadota bacterium]|nr:chromosome partitioning protein ParA [Pseudomonadota bacterium]